MFAVDTGGSYSTALRVQEDIVVRKNNKHGHGTDVDVRGVCVPLLPTCSRSRH